MPNDQREWVYKTRTVARGDVSCGVSDGLRSIVQMATREEGNSKRDRRLRRSEVTTVEKVIRSTAKEYNVSPGEYVGFRSNAAGRDIAACLCRRHTSATLAELSARFGLGHPDSSSDMVKAREEPDGIQ